MVKVPDARVVLLCDLQRICYRAAQGQVPYPVETTEDWREVIDRDDIDAVVIATPQHLHVPMALAAVDAKKNVYCEKALGYTIQECFDIVKAVEEAGVVFQVGHQRHYSEMYRNAKKMIDEGEIGKITFVRAQWHRNTVDRRVCIDPRMDRLVNWRVYSEYTGGLLSEFGAHQIDVVNWFLGSHPESVVGVGGVDWYKDGRDVYDNVCVIYTYPGGVKFVYSSILTNALDDAVEFFYGTRGTIETSLPFGGRLFREPCVLGEGGQSPLPCHQCIGENDENVSEVIPGSRPRRKKCVKVKGKRQKGHSPMETFNAVKSFIECCQTGKKPDADVRVGCNAAVAALMGNIAIREKRVVYWSEFEP